jgi:hypothetical protein
VGHRFDHQRARQHSDLSTPPPSVERRRLLVLTLLAVNGVLCAIATTFFLRLHIGSWPFPVSALIAGLVNAALVRVALDYSPSPRIAAVPLVTWLLTVLVLTLGGPGDDIVFGAQSVTDYVLWLVLVALGTLPPAMVLRQHMAA